MKIAFAHPYTFRIPRGTEKVFILLANQLAGMGHDVTHLTRDTRYKRNVVTISPKVKVREIPTFRYYENLTTIPFYLVEYLRGRYDAVVIAFAKYGEGVPLWLTTKLIGTKYFVRFAYSLEYQPYRFEEFDFPPIGRDAAGLIAVSQAIAKGVEKHFGRNCYVLPQAVESDRFKPARDKLSVRQSLGLPGDAKILLSISAIEERKGIQYAIKMVPEILSSHPRTILCVVGDGPYLPKLKKLAIEIGMHKHVRFYGHQADVVPFYQAADLYTIFSDFEPNPNTMYEALACGVPVVTSNTGCFPEIILDGWGKMVEPKNNIVTVRIISGLLEDKERLSAMGQIGREYVTKNHTLERMAQNFLKIVKTSK